MAPVFIGLGANLGNREANLRTALPGMTRMARVEDVSSLYETEAVGPEQPAYYNAVCRIETGLEPMPLMRFLQTLEEEIGRRPAAARYGPRPIDLDILLYCDRIIDEPALVIPHPLLAERAFALVPLVEIAPDVRHPSLHKSGAELLAAVEKGGIKRVGDKGWDGVAGMRGRIRL